MTIASTEARLEIPSALPAAHLISSPTDHLSAPAPRFIREFEISKTVVTAELAITALGTHRPTINGLRVSPDELAPGWTDYRHRVIVDRYNVTEMLQLGSNTVEILLGNGWYRGRLGRPARRDLYGDQLAVIAQLDLEFIDGSIMSLGTDESWGVTDSEVTANDLYDGCVIDLHRPVETSRRQAEVLPLERSLLVERSFPPVRATQRLAAVTTEERSDGTILLDFGQNVAGWVSLYVSPAPVGRRIVVRHAEVLQNGDLETRPLRDADAKDEFRVPPGFAGTLEPCFTFHGFRYATVEGLENGECLHAEAVVIGSDLTRTGWITTSDALLNRFHENVVWSMRGNFIGLPMDCPQRDERLGWTADIQVFAPTATFLYDSSALLRSWLEDLYSAQTPDGSVPVVIPDIYRRESVATAGWGDAVTVVPWELYQRDGDIDILRRAFTPMRRWVERITQEAGPDLLWVGGHQYGDWLDPSAPPDDPASAITDRDLVATAYYFRSTKILSDTARILGLRDDHRRYAALAEGIRTAFRTAFTTPMGRLASDTQAAYAMGICFGLLDAQQCAEAGRRLADLVRRSGHTISTGFLGTPMVLDALTSTGHQNVAMRLLTQTEQPSWLYPVTVGATTVWERWDSLLPDGRVNPGEMTSFNHYALGAVADWMHRALGGVQRSAPGWATFTVEPPVWSGLEHAHFRLELERGPIDAKWRIEDGIMTLDLQIPAKSVADVVLPGKRAKLQSGKYHFTARMPSLPACPPIPNVRAAMDNAILWDHVLALVRRFRPEWSRRRVAEAAWPYLNKPLPDLARFIGLSIPTPEEDALRSQLELLIT